MSDYNQEAIEFLTRNNVSLKITKAKKTISEICDNAKGCFTGETRKHDKYRFTITTARGTYWSIFWSSINDTKKGIHASEYDVLSCMNVDYSEDFEDFCHAFGYEQFIECDRTGQRKINTDAKRIYNDVKKQSDSLERIFSTEQLEELHEIA